MVRDVRWEPVNGTSVRVEWEQPATGPVNQYNVSLTSLDSSKTLLLLIDGSRASTEVVVIPVLNFVCVTFNCFCINQLVALFQVHGIEPYVAYQLTISGISRGGVGPASPSQRIFISAPHILEKPSGEQFASQSPDVPISECYSDLILIHCEYLQNTSSYFVFLVFQCWQSLL